MEYASGTFLPLEALRTHRSSIAALDLDALGCTLKAAARFWQSLCKLVELDLESQFLFFLDG